MDEPQPAKFASRAAWGAVILTVLAIAFGFVWARFPSGTPRVRSAHPVIAAVPPFALTNQAGQPVTLGDLQGRVWIADIIFTRCAGPCPRMTRRMAALQAELPLGAAVRLVTLTTDPAHDTPAVLQAYGEKAGADFSRWQFLTGPKAEIARVAIDGLKLTSLEKRPEERADAADLFIHSTMFVVVDRLGRLRAAVETEGDDINEAEARRRVLAVAQELLQEN